MSERLSQPANTPLEDPLAEEYLRELFEADTVERFLEIHERIFKTAKSTRPEAPSAVQILMAMTTFKKSIYSKFPNASEQERKRLDTAINMSRIVVTTASNWQKNSEEIKKRVEQVLAQRTLAN